jgi:hypothetical protein
MAKGNHSQGKDKKKAKGNPKKGGKAASKRPSSLKK